MTAVEACSEGNLGVEGIAWLYPAGTVMLAAAVLDEKIARLQSLGLGLAAIAVALVVIA